MAVVLATCFASTHVMADTNDVRSSQSLDYELALQRGTQAVIWGLPAVSMKGFCGSMQTQLGAKENDIVYFSKPMVSRHGFLTANNKDIVDFRVRVPDTCNDLAGAVLPR